MFLSFPSYDVLPLKFSPLFAWISLVPLFIYIRNKDMKRVFLISFITGLIGNYLIYRWIGQFGAQIPGGRIIILIFLIPYLSVFFSMKIIVSEYIARKYESLRFLIYPFCWLIIDSIQSIGFLAFPWPYWGYSQYSFLPIVQSASIIGLFGITFFIILFN